MKDKPTIYFLVEVKAREVEAKTLLALEAAKRGYRAVVGNQDHLKKLIKKGLLPEGVYYYKNLSPGKEKDLGDIVRRGFSVVSQDEESGLLDFSYEKFLAFRSCKETMGLVKHVYCWGKHDASSWKHQYPDKKQDVFSVGSPRVDFWRDEFSPYYKGEVNDLRERFGDFVLIPSNFPLANGFMTTEQRVEQGLENGSIRGNEDKENLIKNISDTREMRFKFVDMIKRLALKFPTTNFIVRPHPVEKVFTWEDDLASVDNAHVLFEGSVSKWVRASSAILHNGCTTSLEARFCGIPSVAYTPFESEINREVPNAVSLQCNSQEEVLEAIGDAMKKGRESMAAKVGMELLSSRFENFQGDPAFKNIVSKLESISVPSVGYPKKTFMAQKYIRRYQFGRYVRVKRGQQGHGDRKFPGLTLSEMKGMQQKLQRIYPSLATCDVHRYMGDIFIIEDAEFI